MKLLDRLKKNGPPRSPRTAPGERIYAVGDIHGRLDLLRLMLAELDTHYATHPRPRSARLILLGDMIDRGPDSAGVLQLVRTIHERRSHFEVLLGNHEDFMMTALRSDDVGLFRTWMAVGGRETLLSFGFDAPCDDAITTDVIAAAAEAVSSNHLEWLAGLPTTFRSGDYFFCHAGVRPGVPLNRQRKGDLLWITEDFIISDHDHGAVIVHGHYITDRAQLRTNRIGLDTGAFRTGILTAVSLEGDSRELISVTGPAPAHVPQSTPF